MERTFTCLMRLGKLLILFINIYGLLLAEHQKENRIKDTIFTLN